jgi:hypothetical protein
MNDEIEQHLAAVEATYGPLVAAGNSRLEGGARLWAQFAYAVASYRTDRTTFAAVYQERGTSDEHHLKVGDATSIAAVIIANVEHSRLR